MKKSWFNFVEEDQVVELKQDFVGSKLLRKVLTSMLEKKINEHFKAQQNRTNYEDSNWAYAQADSMGYCRALDEVINLINDRKQEVKDVNPVGRPRKETYKPVAL